MNEVIRGVFRIIDRLQTAGGVAAVLAALITVSLCVRYVTHGPDEHPPEYLTHAFATILGFYFGTKTVARTRSTRDVVDDHDTSEN
jgi:hypothetical protein